MSDRELERKIKDSFDKITPDVLASVLADCDEKGQELIMKEKESVAINKRPERLRRIAGIAAVFIVLLSSLIGVNAYQTNKAISARVSLDVNPSVEIQVNKKERVIDVVALNEDGKIIIGDMDFSGSDIDVAINALVGSMMRNGYLTDIANSILVTVSGNDAARDAALQTRISEEIDKILEGNKVNGAVLSQVLTKDDTLDAVATEYGITPGKAKLIKEIIEKNDLYKVEDLVSLTINELNLLTLANEIEFADIKTKGTASDAAYIGNDAAEKAALDHAGVDKEDAQFLHSKLEWEDGRMVYDVEFKSAGYEYEYDIDAITGDIVEFEKEVDDDYRPTASITAQGTSNPNNSGSNSGNNAESMISADAAKNAALSYAGISEGNITNYEIEIDYENGKAVYEIEFDSAGYEYDIDVDAYTGTVVKFDKEVYDNAASTQQSAPQQNQQSAPQQNQQSAPTQQSVIGEAVAQSNALSHAGLSAGEVTELKTEYDADDGEYEVEFKSGGYEYDYEIDAYTGAIIKSEKEIDD